MALDTDIGCIFLLLDLFIALRQFPVRFNCKIEILDKSQNREYGLTYVYAVFNESMINLENEMGVLNSLLHSRVVDALNYNIQYFTIGKVKTTQNHKMIGL